MNPDPLITAFMAALYVAPVLGVFALAALIADLIERFFHHRR